MLASGDETGSEKKGICPTADKIDLCTICLCNFEVGDMASKLPCGHIFHCKCIMQWLQKGRNTCPLCRHKLACNPADDESDSEDDQNPLPPHGAHHSPYHPATRALLIESHSYFSTISDDRNNYTYPEERYPQPDRADAASADEMPPRSSVMRRTPGAGRPQSTRYRTYRTYSGQYYNQRGRQMPSPAGADADQTRPTWGQWPPYYPRPTCEEPCWRGPPVPCYPSVPHPYDAYFESQQPYHYPYYPHPQQQLHTAPRNHANGRPHPEHFPQRRPDAFYHPSAREGPRYAPPSGAAPPAVSEQTSTPAPSSGSEGPRDAHQVPAATACPVGEGNRTRPPLAYHGQQLGAAAVSPQLPPHPMMVPMGVPYPAPHIYAVPLEYYNCM